MPALFKTLKTNPVIYVTRDLERALGLPLAAPGYFIVTNWSEFAKSATQRQKNVLLIKGGKILDTAELLSHPRTKRFIDGIKRRAALVVFKNTPRIEKICARQGWRLLNPPAAIGSRVEEKISQLKWLGPLTKYLPPHRVLTGKELVWKGEKYIAQFNRAHTGSGTAFIESETQIKELKLKFPNRPVRLTQFIDGSSFTVNAVVWGKRVSVGNISYQITGLPPFTDQPFATVGNDWALTRQILSDKQSKRIKQIATDIGRRLAKDGWRGLFGIDCIVEEKTKRVFLIEINARQPASTTFENQLQGKKPAGKHIAVFAAHLGALLGLPAADHLLASVEDGAQIIKRVPAAGAPGARAQKKLITKLNCAGFAVVAYANQKPSEDWLRIHSEQGILRRHNEFNATGEKIKKILQRGLTAKKSALLRRGQGNLIPVH